MQAENCAESATTVRPQMKAITSANSGQALAGPISRAQAPEASMQAPATLARFQRSAASPARMQPKAPAATTAKTQGPMAGLSSTAARNTPIQAHMA